MSLTLINGLHGVPSLRIVICLDAKAQATKSFRTRSNLNLELIPHAVANRKHVIMKFLSAKGFKSCSVNTLERAYAVNGLSVESSVLAPSLAAPYMLQLEAKTNDLTPKDLALLARRIPDLWFTSRVTSSNFVPIGSFEIAARFMTASAPF